MSLKGRVAIVGAGMIPFGEHYGLTYEEMMVQAFRAAFDAMDRQADPERVEAVWLSTVLGSLSLGSEMVTGGRCVDALGLGGRPVTRVENACATGADAVRNAAFAVAAGVYDVVAVIGVEKMRDTPPEAYLRMPRPVGRGMTAAGMFALYANRYEAAYGDIRRAMTAISIKNHHNGTLCRYAQLKVELTEEDVLRSPLVVEPFHLYDCCPQTDGAAAVVLASARVAREFTDSPVFIWGIGLGTTFYDLKRHPDFLSSPATVSAAEQAYRMAGVGPDDIEVAEVHDCFSFAELLHYEDLGFAPRGSAAHLALSGRTALDGELPVNPSGGLLSKGHPLGATGVAQLCELFWQLRRQTEETGDRQVRADIGLQHNLGGPLAVAAVTIVSSRPGG